MVAQMHWYLVHVTNKVKPFETSWTPFGAFVRLLRFLGAKTLSRPVVGFGTSMPELQHWEPQEVTWQEAWNCTAHWHLMGIGESHLGKDSRGDFHRALVSVTIHLLSVKDISQEVAFNF